MLKKITKNIDWYLLLFLFPILLISLITLISFSDDTFNFANRQIIWYIVSILFLFIFSSIDFRFLKQTKILIWLYFIALVGLTVLFIFGSTFKGATSWFSFFGFSFQPTDIIKIILILILSKYLSRRHIEIASLKHIFNTFIYAILLFILVFLQPDFGSAIILIFIWLGMILSAGVSKKHLFFLIGIGLLVFSFLWFFIFKTYQKERISTFFAPYTDIRGAGYNAYQSTIAVGSGQLVGKGLGFGTQSRLNFLPESETDFIFASFAEEWGFIGVLILFIFYSLFILRILFLGLRIRGNFEKLFIIGIATYFMSHIIINIGMNIGIFPVTGITLPFMSYGGSHLLAEFISLAIIMNMYSNSREDILERNIEISVLDSKINIESYD